jgi:dienelactone hydrolase/tetratricopeptide (TPR) repeat protein
MRAPIRLAASFGTVLFTAALGSQEPAGAARPAAAQPAARLGTVDFPTSGNTAAQRAFIRGIGYLHSFTYEAAASAFRDAENADAKFALPYWFEALTHSPILWRIDDAPAGRKVLARLAPSTAERLAKAATPRERAYGAAVEAFFADADLATRLRGFADSMVALARRDSLDREASTFASLAEQMYLSRASVPQPEYDARLANAIRFAMRVFNTNPQHPGAAHYLIHVSDVHPGPLTPSFALQPGLALQPTLAQTVLPAAYAYARIAPDAEHAQHMPSHVFLKLGLWDDQVAANERAWRSSVAEISHDHLPKTQLDFHDLLWLQYGYLQQGRWRAARALIDSARHLIAGADTGKSFVVDAHYVVPMLQVAYAMETGHWNDAPGGRPYATPVGPAAVLQRERNFMRIVDVGRATGLLMRGENAPGWLDSVAPQGAADPTAALELQAIRAERRGDTAAALELWRRAGVVEDTVPPIGPPLWLRAHERAGALLLATHRPAEAEREYARALRFTPNRSLALLGVARARLALGDSVGAAFFYRRVAANWRTADPDVPALDEVRRGAAMIRTTVLATDDAPLVKKRVAFKSGSLWLEGYVFKPAGRGPFPTLLWNHGSEPHPGAGDQFDGVARVFVPHGFAVFAPTRRGHDESDGPYITFERSRAVASGGQRAGDGLAARLLTNEHLDDQLAGLAWLKTVPFVDTTRIVVAGCSFGGVQASLAAENARARGIVAAVSMSPAAMNWDHNAPLKERLMLGVSRIDVPVFLIQPPKDVSLGPIRDLSAEFRRLGKPYQAKIYPDTIPAELQTHCFGGSQGNSIWAADVLSFVDSVLARRR